MKLAAGNCGESGAEESVGLLSWRGGGAVVSLGMAGDLAGSEWERRGGQLLALLWSRHDAVCSLVRCLRF